MRPSATPRRSAEPRRRSPKRRRESAAGRQRTCEWRRKYLRAVGLSGIEGLQVNLSDGENGQLNPLGINCLRAFPVNGRVNIGAFMQNLSGKAPFAWCRAVTRST
jgi:hypothetical protein